MYNNTRLGMHKYVYKIELCINNNKDFNNLILPTRINNYGNVIKMHELKGNLVQHPIIETCNAQNL